MPLAKTNVVVDEGLLLRFKEVARKRHNGEWGHLGSEFEEALRLYLGKYGETVSTVDGVTSCTFELDGE